MLVLRCADFLWYGSTNSLSSWAIHHLLTSQWLLHIDFLICLTVCINGIIGRLVKWFRMFGRLTVHSFFLWIRLLVLGWMRLWVWRLTCHFILILTLLSFLSRWLWHVQALTKTAHATILRLLTLISSAWRFYFCGRLQTARGANIFGGFARGTRLSPTIISLLHAYAKLIAAIGHWMLYLLLGQWAQVRLLGDLASAHGPTISGLAAVNIVIIVDIPSIVLKGCLGARMLVWARASAGVGKTIVRLRGRDGVELLHWLCVQVLIGKVWIVYTHGIVLDLRSLKELFVNLWIVSSLLLAFHEVHLLKILLRLWRLRRRVLCTLITCIHHVVGLVAYALRWHTHLNAIVSLSWDALICRWINNLREISFSSNFLRSGLVLLRRRLLIDLLLLHGIVLWAVVNWQFVQTATGNTILIRAYGLIVRERIVWCVLTHDCLNLTLVVKTRNLYCRFVPILGPQAVYWALSCPFLPFGILAAFSILLHWRDLYSVWTTVQLLLLLLLLIGLANSILRHHALILTHCRIGSHGHAVASLARSKLSILVVLIVNVTESGIRLLRLWRSEAALC